MPENPDGKMPPVEIIAEAVLEIAEGFKRIENGRLSKRALIVLVHDAVRGRVGRPAIEEVLDVLPQLASIYLRKKGGTNAGG